MRAPAQGPCSYASFHTTTAYIPVLTAQREDAAALVDDGTARGWDTETERHLRLIHRLTTLIDDAATHPAAM